MGPKKQTKKDVPESPKVEQPPPIPLHELQGVARFEYPNQLVYEGQWRLINNMKMKHGQGELTQLKKGVGKVCKEHYKGSWKEDHMDGIGKYHYGTGGVYEGEWHKNQHHGKGSYKFPDGSVYEGEWRNHLPHGQGVYTDVKHRPWNGEYRQGTYQTRLQNQLRGKRLAALKQQKLLTKSHEWLTEFGVVFAKSQKKSYKENLLPFFGVQEQLKTQIKEPYPKFEERPPEKWNDVIAFAKQNISERIVLKDSIQSKFIEPERILAKQFSENTGQIVYYISQKQERAVKIGLCQVTQESWSLVYFHDSAEPEKKK